MHSALSRTLAAVFTALVLTLASLAQQPAEPAVATPSAPRAHTPQTPQPSTAQPSATPRAPENFVEEKGFKGKVFEIKYRDPWGLQRALQPLGSGFRGATMSVNQEMRTLAVRDFPENIAAIEDALKRLDTPEAPRPDIEFSVNVLIASNAPTASGEYPPELSDVVKQLQSALRYKNYGLLTSSIHRSKEGPQGVSNTGVAESKLFAVLQPESPPTFYEYFLENISIDNASGSPVVNVANFRFNMRIPLNLGSQINYQNVGFRSPVSLRQGEKVVVGSTTMGDKGLVVVISARVVK